jgi:hypothetical protein
MFHIEKEMCKDIVKIKLYILLDILKHCFVKLIKDMHQRHLVSFLFNWIFK